jgi:sugar fermentation stimulation protein A
MTYANTITARFISRPNRFIAEVEVDGKAAVAHVKNTGRCKELLVPGAAVVLSVAVNPLRSTKYDLIAVWKGKRLINMDSQAPNKAFAEFLRSGRHMEGITLVKPEVRYGLSRFDFYIEAGERKIFIEVKGVTLEEDGVVLFPDAPTERGIKHLGELARSVREGYEAQIAFVIQMRDVRYFMSNDRAHPQFGAALAAARAAGVTIAAYDCEVTENCLTIGKTVDIRL